MTAVVSSPAPEWTLADAQEWLRERVDHGDRCPCCTQLAKVYRRRLSHVPAAVLVVMHREDGCDWTHVPTLVKRHLRSLAHQGGYATLGAYWRLIEEESDKREDGGRAGYWRLTDLGADFVRSRTLVPKYARLYDGRCLGFAGELVDIRECLGQRFNFDELMGRA